MEEKTFEYFYAKFSELADEAQSYGHSLVLLIENDNPITREIGIHKIYRGKQTILIGLLQIGLMDFMPR